MLKEKGNDVKKQAVKEENATDFNSNFQEEELDEPETLSDDEGNDVVDENERNDEEDAEEEEEENPYQKAALTNTGIL